MSQDYRPDVWDWEPITQGCTYPAARIYETEGATPTETALNRVVVTIQARGSDADALVLDSDSTGVTIDNGAIGEWDFTIDEISADTMDDLAAGFYDVNVTITHDTDKVVCVSKGTWEILSK